MEELKTILLDEDEDKMAYENYEEVFKADIVLRKKGFAVELVKFRYLLIKNAYLLKLIRG